ncbi:MAG: hypothetical protein BWY62_01444 [Firmicutes bacterium ADurb.Bin356]|nr:MAG: hypothetical protein BWY62_01444 [Firmicutes bacterium ADurb.Bin356]
MRELDGLRRYKSAAHKSVLEAYPSIDTGIRFMKADGKLYMVRNMMDSTFTPYAVIVMECDEASLYESIRGIVWVMAASVVLVVLPVLLVYVLLQKNIIKGLTVGAIKG